MTFTFSDYYNDENICLSEERIRELFIDYLKKYGGECMKVLDKVTGAIVEVAFITNNGSVYHLINSEGVIYRRFSDEVEREEAE